MPKSKFPIYFVLLALTVLGSLLAFFTNVVSDDSRIAQWFQSTIGSEIKIAGYIFLLVVACVLTFLYHRHSARDSSIGIEAQFNLDVEGFVKELHRNYKTRYENKLVDVIEIPLELKRNDKKIGFRKDDNRATVNYLVREFEKKGRLLIMGRPGAGKTVLLLGVAQQFTENVLRNLQGHDERSLRKLEPFPIIFNLSSWTTEYKTFEEWVVSVLAAKYNILVEKDFAQQLLERKLIIPFLDGLDELAKNEENATEQRVNCLRSLNKFLRDHKRSVLCCRVEEFNLIETRETGLSSLFESILTISDLDNLHIRKSLLLCAKHVNKKGRDAAKHLLKMWESEKNIKLWEALDTPFYLNLAMDVTDYPVLLEDDFPQTTEEIKEHLLKKFIEEKLVKTSEADFDHEQMRIWFKWLAGSLFRKKQVIFKLEDIQPSDLSKKWTSHLVRNIVQFSSLFFILVIGVSVIALLKQDGSVKLVVLMTIFFLIFIGLLVSVQTLLEILDEWIKKKIKIDKVDKPKSIKGFLNLLPRYAFWRTVFAEGLVLGCLSGVVIGVYGVITKRLVIGIALGLIFGFVGICVRGLSIVFKGDVSKKKIQPEGQVRLDFSRFSEAGFFRKTLFKGLGLGFLLGTYGGLFVGATMILGDGWNPSELLKIIYSSIFLGSFLGLCGGVIWIFEGIKLRRKFIYIESAYQSLAGGLLLNFVGILFLLVIGCAILFSKGSIENPDWMVLFMGSVLFIGFIAFFDHALFKHFILRITLYYEGAMPLNYVTFLNHAASLRILEKDGGEWRFRHQYLQYYFTDKLVEVEKT